MQRLEIAWARVRNTEVSILDEATSALDPTSRFLLVEDFVLENGRVAEQGYRSDLQVVGCNTDGRGEFKESQKLTGRFLLEKNVTQVPPIRAIHDDAKDDDRDHVTTRTTSIKGSRHQSFAAQRLFYGDWTWMLDVVADLTKTNLLAR